MDEPFFYYSDYRSEICEFLPSDFSSHLDVGCGCGQFGVLLKTLNPQLELWGIEVLEDVAAKVSPAFDNVLQGDALSLMDQLPAQYFDSISFNDSLEHMVDPYTVLAGIKTKLAPEGQLTVSLPNMRFFPVLKALMLKRTWQYEDWGVMDRTHLRFFTRSAMIDMLEQAGFELLQVSGINRARTLASCILSTMLPWWFDDIEYPQFVLTATLKK